MHNSALIIFEYLKVSGELVNGREAGFECVTGEYNDGGKIFRKRKQI
jgi:hypothetical protein